MPWNASIRLRGRTLIVLCLPLLGIGGLGVQPVDAGFLDSLFAGPAQGPPPPAVARVVADEGDSLSMGSGTLIHVAEDYGWVITNWHVVRGARGPLRVEFPCGFQSPAEVVKTDQRWDLALLAIWRPPVSPMPLSADIPQIGDLLVIAGYGQGTFRQSRGRLQHYAAPEPNQPDEFLEISTSARQGDSGGPMINGRGELAGVLFGSGAGMTTGSHIGRVRTFLASVGTAPPSPAAPATGVAPTAPMDALARGDQPISEVPPPFMPPPFMPPPFMPSPLAPAAAISAPSVSSPSPPLAVTSVAEVPAPFVPPVVAGISESAPTPSHTGTDQPDPEDVLRETEPWLDSSAALALAEDEELPFAELAEETPRVTRQVARTSEKVPASVEPWEPPTHAPPAALDLSPGAPAADTLVAEEPGPAHGGMICEGGVCRLPCDLTGPPGGESPLLSIPSSPSPAAAGADDVDRAAGRAPSAAWTLPLPRNDTQAFLLFVCVVGFLIYVAPRSQSNDSPGESTTG